MNIRLIANIISGVLAVGALSFMYAAQSRNYFIMAAVVWFLLLLTAYYVFSLRMRDGVLMLTTFTAFTSVLTLVEFSFLAALLIGIGGLVFGGFWLWATHASRSSSAVTYKTWRRLVMAMWVFDMYALGSVLFAVPIFFQRVHSMYVAVILGMLAGFCAYMIWDLYDLKKKQTLFWAVLLGFCVFQLMTSIQWLPLGYFSLAVFVVWPWYLGQLFIRFHLTHSGIIWKRQVNFLVTNVLLYIFSLYIVRWV